jgi:hypothetical protein
LDAFASFFAGFSATGAFGFPLAAPAFGVSLTVFAINKHLFAYILYK